MALSTTTPVSNFTAVLNQMNQMHAERSLDSLKNETNAYLSPTDATSASNLYQAGGLSEADLDSHISNLSEKLESNESLKVKISNLTDSALKTALLAKVEHIATAILFAKNFLVESKKSFSLSITGLDTIKPNPLLGKIAKELLKGNSIKIDRSRGNNGFLAKGASAQVFYAKIGDITFIMKRFLPIPSESMIKKVENEGRYSIRLSGQQKNLLSIITQSNEEGSIMGYYEESFCNLVDILNPESAGGHALRYNEDEMQSMYKDLFSAVKFLNDHNLAHRDIKFLNVLHHENNPEDALGTLKLADFGELIPSDSPAESVGTPGFCSPEALLLFTDESPKSKKMDSWSLGIMMYIQLFDQPKFHKPNFENHAPIRSNFKKLMEQPGAMFQKIMSAKLEEPTHDANYQLRDLLTKLLVLNPTDRYTVEEALAHPYFTGEDAGVNYLSKIQANYAAIEGTTPENLLIAPEEISDPDFTPATATADASVITQSTPRTPTGQKIKVVTISPDLPSPVTYGGARGSNPFGGSTTIRIPPRLLFNGAGASNKSNPFSTKFKAPTTSVPAEIVAAAAPAALGVSNKSNPFSTGKRS